MLQFCHRRGLFEILQDFRVVQNVFAIKGEGHIRQLGKRSFPLRREHSCEMTVGVARIRPRQGIERGCDHELEIALGQDHVGVLPVQHFALFGNADFPGKCARGLSIDGAMRRSAAAADSTTAAVK